MRGAGRRVRLRQIGQRAVGAETAALSDRVASLRHHPFQGPRTAQGFRKRDARNPRQRHLDHLSGADDLAQSAAYHRGADRRDPLAAQRHRRIDGAGADARIADAGRHPRSGDAAAKLSAPIVRRPAPARHDRDGARQRAGSPDRRRADHRARRHRAGADPGAAGGDTRAARHEPVVHHPRSRHRPPHRRCGLRDERRQDRRAGPGRAGLYRAETSLHARAAGGRAKARSGAAAAERAGGDVGRQSEGLVPDQARAAALHRRPHQGGRRRQPRGAQGRDARRRRRIRLGQDHAGAGACCG